MLKIFLRVLLTAAALLAIASAVPGIAITHIYTAVIVAILWGIISITIKPLIQLLALPITILTLGLFSFIINALLFWIVAGIVPGFTVSGFVPALEGSVLLTIVNWVLHKAI